MVKDIRSIDSDGSSPDELIDVNGMLYFSANDGTHGSELWKSDGTESGTVMVKDINPDSADSSPSWLTNVNGKLLFVAWEGTKRTLWGVSGNTANRLSDFANKAYSVRIVGTANRHALVLVIIPGEMSLYTSDGTEAGTVELVHSDDVSP